MEIRGTAQRSSRRGLLIGLVLVAVAWATTAVPSSPLSASGQLDAEGTLGYLRVTVADDEEADRLLYGGYDVLEARDGDDLFVLGDGATLERLRSDGFTVAVDQVAAIDSAGLDFQNGYRTWDEHVDHLNQVAGANPGLAIVIDYGDSWLKEQGRGGNDLLAICITNRQPGDCALTPSVPKPRAMVMAAIHARELATPEVAYRLIDDLVAGYDVDADITHLLDTTEVWIIPVANPDGYEVVEGGGTPGLSQRKNANDSLGGCTFYGVDLNRNAGYNWNTGGSSSDPCSDIYRGQSATSEPEQAALETLFGQLWADRRSPNGLAPSDTTGTFVSLHAFGELVFMPFGNGTVAPNIGDLRGFAFRMSHYNQYRTGTAPEILYTVSGSTDDHAYGDLGVMSATFEVGPFSGACSGFRPAYSCVDATLYPTNRDALLYALRVADAPYTAPAGPTTFAVTAPDQISAGQPFTLTATVNDDALGNAPGSVGRPLAQAVAAAEYSIDVAPEDGGATTPMSAVQAPFNQTTEDVTVAVPTAGLAPGRHTVFVRGRDAEGNWGPSSARFVTVTGPTVPPQLIDDFETDSGWVRNPTGTDSATRGLWEVADPEPTSSSGITVQRGDTVSGSQALVTHGAAGSGVGSFDIDGGPTTARSAPFELPTNADTLGFWYYLAHLDNGETVDSFSFSVIGADGTTTEVLSEQAGGFTRAGQWTQFEFDANPWVGQTIRFQVAAADNGSASLIEAAVDNLYYLPSNDPDPDPDPDPVGATLLGAVGNTTGAPEPGVAVDLFTAAADGSRDQWLRSATTGTDGGYDFGVDAGCYVVTFIAPTDRQFTNGSQWLNAGTCVADGETVTGLDATVVTQGAVQARIGDSVTYRDGSPAGLVEIDLFAANADGSRGPWLNSVATDADGGYGFDVDAGCYVVTFIAPTDQQFTNGSQWLNAGACVTDGQVDDSVDAVLVTGGQDAALTGSVVDGGGAGVGGVLVDLFTTTGDGSRGTWLTSTTTAVDGTWRHEPAPGCYVLTLVAPAGETFTNGNQWLNLPACVEADETVSGLDAALQ